MSRILQALHILVLAPAAIVFILLVFVTMALSGPLFIFLTFLTTALIAPFYLLLCVFRKDMTKRTY